MIQNLFQFLPPQMPDEIVERLCETETVRIERILSKGQNSPPGFWYDQDRHEFVVLLRGQAGIRLEDSDEVFHLGPGDFLDIRAHVRHRVEYTDPDQVSVWLAVFYE